MKTRFVCINNEPGNCVCHFLQKLKIPFEQLEIFIEEVKKYFILVEGAPNANYDVELILPNMKNFTVFKRYFLPLQGLLPVIPQVSVSEPIIKLKFLDVFRGL